MPAPAGLVKGELEMQKDGVARGLSPALLKPWMLPTCCGELAPDTAGCGVCMASVEKRIRAEQACRLCELILASLSRFQDWLRAAELWAASPASSQVPFAVAKEELKKFEVLQRQIQEKLHPLESLNRQYRQLVQANRSSLQGRWLRAVVQEINEGWDNLQKRTAAIIKRLKYFVSQREEFEWERETVQVQLTELDLRLTDVEHFSGGSSLEKMKQLQEFQEAVQSNTEQLDWLLVSGEQLIQRSEPQDAEVLEEELQELSCYCQEVFCRVSRFRRRLVSKRLVFEDEWLSDRETDVESDCFTDVSLEPEVEGEAGRPPPAAWLSQSTPHKAVCCHHLHRCGAAWGDSLDLEWDPSVDVGGSTSHDEEDSSYCSAITGTGCHGSATNSGPAGSGVCQWEEPSRRHSRQQGTAASCPSRCGRDAGPADLNLTPDELMVPADRKPYETLSWGFRGPGCEQPNPIREQSPGAVPFLADTWRWLGSQDGLCLSLVTKRKVEIARDSSGNAPLRGSRHLQSLALRDGACRQTELVGFDPERIESWLGQACVEQDKLDVTQPHQRSRPGPSTEESAIITEKGPKSQPSAFSGQPRTGPRVLAGVKKLLLSAAGLLVLLLAGTILLSLAETPCSKASGYALSSHFMLKYVNGPPPT